MRKIYWIPFPSSVVLWQRRKFIWIFYTLLFHNYEMRMSQTVLRIFHAIIQPLIMTCLLKLTIIFNQYTSGRFVT